MKVRSFVGLVGSINFECRNGERLSTYNARQDGDVRFEIERYGRLLTLSLTQEQLLEAVEKWLNDDSQFIIENFVSSFNK